ncbi:LamG domain-containing protein, partial [Reichenbachiella sp.]
MFKNLHSRGLRTLFLCLIVFVFGSGKLLAQNRALDLPGADNSVDISYALNSGGYTVETWIYIYSTGISHGVFSKTSDHLANPLDVYVGTDMKVKMWMGDGSTTNESVSITTLNQYQWYHIAVSYDPGSTGTEGKLYINGIEEATQNVTVFNNTVDPMTIGDRGDDGTNADARFDDFRVWRDVRTPAEILNNFRSELIGNE